MIVLDASVLIAHASRHDAHHARAVAILRAAGGHTLLTSALTLAEVLVTPARAGQLARMTAVLTELGIVGVALAVDDAPALARLRADTGLRLPDCCVLMVAEGKGAALAAFDERLLGVARERGIEVVDAAT